MFLSELDSDGESTILGVGDERVQIFVPDTRSSVHQSSLAKAELTLAAREFCFPKACNTETSNKLSNATLRPSQKWS